jgi:hypothetical protein
LTKNKLLPDASHFSSNQEKVFLVKIIVMLVYENFYKEVGNLFYAVAAIDGKITRNEKKMITGLVRYIWRPLENTTDKFGTDAANIILFQFDVNEGFSASPAEQFKSFVDYFDENRNDIDSALREKILSGARNIAESTRKINNAELPMLMKLRYLMAHGQLNKAV